MAINRVTKVVKGGKNLSFSALVVVGDGQGVVGFGIGKAKEVPSAIKKGIEAAKKNLIRVPLKGTTIPHPALGRYGAGRVLLKPAPEGTGIIAGGGVRAVVESCGIHNVLTKSLGTANPHNVVRATFTALSMLKDPRDGRPAARQGPRGRRRRRRRRRGTYGEGDVEGKLARREDHPGAEPDRVRPHPGRDSARHGAAPHPAHRRAARHAGDARDDPQGAPPGRRWPSRTMATNLSNLKPAKGSKFTKKRVGRGPGSGSGKTAGRGYKGAQVALRLQVQARLRGRPDAAPPPRPEARLQQHLPRRVRGGEPRQPRRAVRGRRRRRPRHAARRRAWSAIAPRPSRCWRGAR